MSAGDTLEQHALAAVMAGVWRGRHLLHSCLGSTAQLQQQSKSAHRYGIADTVRPPEYAAGARRQPLFAGTAVTTMSRFRTSLVRLMKVALDTATA